MGLCYSSWVSVACRLLVDWRRGCPTSAQPPMISGIFVSLCSCKFSLGYACPVLDFYTNFSTWSLSPTPQVSTVTLLAYRPWGGLWIKTVHVSWAVAYDCNVLNTYAPQPKRWQGRLPWPWLIACCLFEWHIVACAFHVHSLLNDTLLRVHYMYIHCWMLHCYYTFWVIDEWMNA